MGNTRSDMALEGGADGQADDIEKHCLNLTPSKGAPPEEGSKEHEAMGDLATLAGLPKGSNIPPGTLKALSNAWKRGNFVRSTTKRAEVMDGDQYMILREAAYMDCSGQANVLADPNHGGRPFVFAGLDEAITLGPRRFK